MLSSAAGDGKRAAKQAGNPRGRPPPAMWNTRSATRGPFEGLSQRGLSRLDLEFVGGVVEDRRWWRWRLAPKPTTSWGRAGAADRGAPGPAPLSRGQADPRPP